MEQNKNPAEQDSAKTKAAGAAAVPSKEKGGDKTTETTVNTDFMREEIRQRPVNKKRLLRRTAITAFLAVLFGAVACAVFLLLEPVINNAINPSEEPAPVTFPEETATEEMSPEDMIANDEQIQEAEAEKKAASLVDVDSIRDEVLAQVRKDLANDSKKETQKSSAEEYRQLYASLSEIAQEASRSIVTVTAITTDYDWAGDAFHHSGSASGLILAVHGKDILILTDDDDYPDAQEIRVTFDDGEQAAAQIVTQDTVTGFTILKVSEADLSKPLSENDGIQVAALGSSARQDLIGKPVIAIGSPSGTAGSVSYGIVTNADLALDITDSDCRQITTDIYGSTKASGVLTDLDGNVIGWIDMKHGNAGAQNEICAIGITGMKSLIEKMSNEIRMGYLGIHGTEIPSVVQEEEGLPEGAYVIQTEMDSAAMDAGIQSGDIITAVGGKRVTTYSALVDILLESRSGRQLSITVMRQQGDGYGEVNLVANLTPRLVFGGSQ